MIRILDNRNRTDAADAFAQMFAARAEIFGHRLGWAVDIREGVEIDVYDREHDPLYLVSEDDAGRLTGSLRVLRGDGPIMLDNEFADFFDEPVSVNSSAVWECTRFCVHPASASTGTHHSRQVSTELLAGLCEAAIEAGVEQIIGVFEAPMTRVYRRIGWCPGLIAEGRDVAAGIYLGVWDVSEAALAVLKANLEPLPARLLAA